MNKFLVRLQKYYINAVRLPCPVNATKSAAPLNGFVKIPTNPNPTPEIKLLVDGPLDTIDCRG